MGIPNDSEEPADVSDITVILNLYRRPEYLAAQIAGIRAQIFPPREIWLWVNDHEANRSLTGLDTLGLDRIFRNDFNWKYAGRFAAGLLARTEYIAFFDDDTIPGPRWFANCLSTMKESEGILGTAGIRFTSRDYDQECGVHGWSRPSNHTVAVDFVGHAWFLRRDWLKAFWREDLATWDTAEDMHLSFAAQKHLGLETFCPPHPANDLSLHGSTRGRELGADGRSGGETLGANAFYKERERAFLEYVRRGWKLRGRRSFWRIEVRNRLSSMAWVRSAYEQVKGILPDWFRRAFFLR